MGVACQILINKSKEGVFKAGQVVSGVVKYAVDKPTEYRAITLSLLGTGKCRWTRGSSKNRRTYTGTEEYITNHIHILSKEQEPVQLEIGSYEYPYEVHLPEDLPSSFKNITCTIHYWIQLEFEKTNFLSFNKKFKVEIPVYGFVESKVEGPVIFGLEKSLFNFFSGETPVINLKAEILKSCLTPGENAQLVLVVTNDTDVVPSIRATLHCYTTYKADCGETDKDKKSIKDCSVEGPKIPARRVANVTLTIPTLPKLYSNCSKIMDNEYRIKVTVRLPMPHRNAVVEIPVVIGERKGVQNLDLALEFTEDMEDGPPSYWEAMSEHKEVKEKNGT